MLTALLFISTCFFAFTTWWHRSDYLFWKMMYYSQSDHNRHLFNRAMDGDDDGEDWKQLQD